MHGRLPCAELRHGKNHELFMAMPTFCSLRNIRLTHVRTLAQPEGNGTLQPEATEQNETWDDESEYEIV